MATYVVGDIQGCNEPFQRLLKQVGFDRELDTLWLAGDLVNRGPDNLAVLRYVKGLGNHARVVLGNHDLHLLAVHAGAKKLGKKDTITDVLNAPDCAELIDWLRHQRLLYREGPWVLSHAGVPHIWSVDQALAHAREVEEVLASVRCRDFLHNMYGNTPGRWKDKLKGWERLRVITNYFTRMRFVEQDGSLNLKAKEGLGSTPPGTHPWFEYPRKDADMGARFLFGHWAALEGYTGQEGQNFRHRFTALDTGCVWGGALTMMRLDDQTLHSTPARRRQSVIPAPNQRQLSPMKT